jgi:hypothetical protein
VPTLAADSSAVLTITGYVELETATARLENYDFEPNDAQGWLSISGGSNTFTLENDSTEAYGGASYFYCTNNGLGSSAPAVLQSPILDTTVTNKQVRFWHHYNTDSGYDGGYLEYTTDGGVSWVRLPLQVNGYNGDLNSTFNPTGAGAAFTGNASDYFESAGLIPDGATQIRFVFSEDAGGGGGDGWWIDDVKIVVNPVTLTNTASVTDPAVSGARVHTASANTLILNNLCDDVNLLITDGIITDGTETYVKNMITIDGQPGPVTLGSTSDAKLYAGDGITIEKNFLTELGATLLLHIKDCDEQ